MRQLICRIAVDIEPKTVSSQATEHIRPIDQAVLDLLRQGDGLSVQQLIEKLEVTATAVRQRLERLVEVGLIERRKVGVGRGRPQYHYFLTRLGMRYSSASYSDLAAALWAEVMELPDPGMRSQILHRVAKRMGQSLKDTLPQDGGLVERFEAVRSELGRRKVPASVTEGGELPVLEVHSCPYPDLASDDKDRQLCEMEQEMFSEAIGRPLHLDCCRLDGHQHCQFRPVAESPSAG